MKVIIAGSRDITDYDFLLTAIVKSGFPISEVVSGTARGADRLGERYAADCKLSIAKFPAQWDVYGKSAGYIRNSEMAQYADALIALWDGQSRGTMHMIDLARRQQLKVFVAQYDDKTFQEDIYMLFKSSDNNQKPNMALLSSLINQHGPDSEEVQAYLTSFAADAAFMKKAESLINNSKSQQEGK